MANRTYRDTPSSHSSHTSRLISQRQTSDSRVPTTCFLIFENSNCNSNEICFWEYRGTHAARHRSHKLFIPQLKQSRQRASDDTYDEFASSVREVLQAIPPNDLSSYTISIRTGVSYFFSKAFRFNLKYSINEVHEAMQKTIPLTDERYYFPARREYHTEEYLRSSFNNVKPISQPEDFVRELENFKFFVREAKHIFRIYLQSDDKQTHVCTVDPSANYSIVEFSKDFQRNSNIDVIRDRRGSNFSQSKTYDDVFDFRVQFQYNPRTSTDQNENIVYELQQQLPELDQNFKNEHILTPNEHSEHKFSISEQLYPYIRYIRRDFGDIYHYQGTDELFENFTIYLEASVEYSIDRSKAICRRTFDTHGLVYARLNLDTMISSNEITDEELLIEKLWDMGKGLTDLAGKCTTSDTQQSTKFYTPNGGNYTTEDEVLVRNLLKCSTIHSMLKLPDCATVDEIKSEYNRIDNQLQTKWNCIPKGPVARDRKSVV